MERRDSSGSNFLPQRTTFKFLAPRARTPVKCPWVGREMLKLQAAKLICAWASKVIFGEETLSLGTKMIVRLTWYAKPHTTGLPMNTARAPSANALSTSVPCLIPPSTKTSTFPSTAFTTSGRASIYK